jgi:hypothetical protein
MHVCTTIMQHDYYLCVSLREAMQCMHVHHHLNTYHFILLFLKVISYSVQLQFQRFLHSLS